MIQCEGDGGVAGSNRNLLRVRSSANPEGDERVPELRRVDEVAEMLVMTSVALI